MRVLKTVDGKEIKRISRWIKIREVYNITEKHSLYEYAEKIDEDENILNYFVFHGKKYALSQFIRFGTPWTAAFTQWYEDGKLHFMSGYDSTNYYNPILLEIDEYGENVRLYQEL